MNNLDLSSCGRYVLTMKQQTVFHTLNKSKAQLLAEREINSQIKLALWKNQQDHVVYNTEKAHTLSLYVKGGAGCRRVDANYVRGKQDTLCIIPSGASAEWLIEDEFHFFHLYFTDSSIKRFAARVMDKEPQLVSVPDLTFHSDQQLNTLILPLVGALQIEDNANSLYAQESINEVFCHLLKDKQYCLNTKTLLRGGLSPAASRKATDYIHNNFDQKINLFELANLADLSEYHFQRMFKVTHGTSPHNYLTEVRIEKAQKMIIKGIPLVQVAQQCGFSHQSHFNRIFKKITGLTPKEYARCIA